MFIFLFSFQRTFLADARNPSAAHPAFLSSTIFTYLASQAEKTKLTIKISLMVGLNVGLRHRFRLILAFASMMVGLNGLEPSTSRLSGVRSNQLSYRPSSWWR